MQNFSLFFAIFLSSLEILLEIMEEKHYKNQKQTSQSKFSHKNHINQSIQMRSKQSIRSPQQVQSTQYSKPQQKNFKSYAQQVQFTKCFNDLLFSIEKRKVTRLTQEVKVSNKAFRRYMNANKIVHLKIEDVIEFQEMYETTNNNCGSIQSSSQVQEIKCSLVPSLLSRQSSKPSHVQSITAQRQYPHSSKKLPIYSVIDKQVIKKGFMTLVKKLETLKTQQFINQTKYLQGVLVRECQKLKEYGSNDEEGENVQFQLQLKGRKYAVNKMKLCEEIEKDQKVNGAYLMVMKNVREQTAAMQRAESTFALLMKS